MTQYKRIGGNRQWLPKKHTLKDGSTTGNFDIMPADVIEAEGFYPCESAPTLLPTQKLGEDILGVDNVWRYGVIDKTQAELDAESLAQWKSDMAATDMDMPRWAEDLFDLMTGAKTLAEIPETAAKVANKKDVRATKP